MDYAWKAFRRTYDQVLLIPTTVQRDKYLDIADRTYATQIGSRLTSNLCSREGRSGYANAVRIR